VEFFEVPEDDADEYETETYVPRAALEAVEAKLKHWEDSEEAELDQLRDRLEAEIERAEQAEKQVEKATAERDEFAKKGLAWMKLLHEGEKQLEELREAAETALMALTPRDHRGVKLAPAAGTAINVLRKALTSQPDTAKTNLARMEEVEYPGLEMVDEAQPDTASEAPRCEHVFRMSSYGRCIKCGIQGNPMGGREDR